MVRSKAWECVALAAILALAACGQSRNKRRQTEMRIVLSSMMAPLSTTGETPRMKG
jgi:hypothetical protein